MFTGIIEEMGRIKDRKKAGDSSTLTIECHKVLKGTDIGDSIAVNGVCLTVIKIGRDYFEADVMNETLFRSILGQIPINSEVNLERAMPACGRFGGHIVSGHIDGIGTLSAIKKDGNACWYKISAGAELLKYIVEKGSIAINGISLTVAAVEREAFFVSVIPHTRSVTGMKDLKEGSLVNLECDLVGKYVERLLFFKEKISDNGDGGISNEKKSGLTQKFLFENGFL